MTEEGYYCYDSGGWAKKMRIERAQEELEILESQHPNHYQSLKLELRSFISFLQESLSPASCDAAAATSTATTQASTTVGRRSKRKREEDREAGGICLERVPRGERGTETERRSVLFDGVKEKDAAADRVDLVLRRAHACLTKIRRLKFQLSPSY